MVKYLQQKFSWWMLPQSMEDNNSYFEKLLIDLFFDPLSDNDRGFCYNYNNF